MLSLRLISLGSPHIDDGGTEMEGQKSSRPLSNLTGNGFTFGTPELDEGKPIPHIEIVDSRHEGQLDSTSAFVWVKGKAFRTSAVALNVDSQGGSVFKTELDLLEVAVYLSNVSALQKRKINYSFS